METIWLKSHKEYENNNLDWLLNQLEKKSEKNTKEYFSAYELWTNNEVLATMTRNKNIEKQSINFIANLMKKTLEKSKNPKSKIILEKLA